MRYEPDPNEVGYVENEVTSRELGGKAYMRNIG